MARATGTVKLPRAKSEIEEMFALHLRADRVEAPAREHKFDPARDWRFDFAWPKWKVAVEIDGGTRSGGRHVRGDGFERDCEKLNAAALDGWVVLRFTGRMVRNGIACRQAQLALTFERLRHSERTNLA